MAMTNLQKWIRLMKKRPPESSILPEATSEDKRKILAVDGDGKAKWEVPLGGDIPLEENESICIMKD